MSYKTDRNSLFNQLPPGVRQGEVTSGQTVENQSFQFPTNVARVASTANLQKGSLSDANAESVTLTRGFMRNLMTDLGENQPRFPDVRCFFQFNPQDIEHVIEARKDMYLPILQDPQQLRQPMAGNAMFNFELIFDRTMEVNSSTYSTVSRGGEPIPDPKSPGTVGVFHDLRVLYSIIGQGLSEELLEAQQVKLKNDAKAFAIKNYNSLNVQYNAQSDAFTSNKTLTNPEDDVYSDDPNSVATADFLNKLTSDPASINSFLADFNIGNSAFLIPQPCRVVFSPVFMVDGFVMGTKVLFTKFSTKMIPTQCKVYITMQATYLGFARAKTFVTEQLDETSRQNTEDERTAVSEVGGVGFELSSAVTNAVVGFSSDPRVITQPSGSSFGEPSIVTYTSKLNDIPTRVGWAYQPLWLFATKDFWYTRPTVAVYTGAPPGTGAKGGLIGDNDYNPTYTLQSPTSTRTPAFQPQLSVRICPSEADKNRIKEKIFESLQSSNPKLNFEIKVHFFGPFSTESAANSFLSTNIGQTPFQSLSKSSISSLYVGKYGVTKEIGTKEKWDDYAKDPQNWSMDMGSSNDTTNKRNTAPNPITINTKNSSNISIVDAVNSRITAAYASAVSQFGDTPDTRTAIFNTQKLYYGGISSQSQTEEVNPTWQGPTINFRDQVGMPTEVYQITTGYANEQGSASDRLDSLLQLVDSVHQLSSKYFAVVVDAVVKYSIETEAGIYKQASPGGVRSSFVALGGTIGKQTSLNFGWGGLAIVPI